MQTYTTCENSLFLHFNVQFSMFDSAATNREEKRTFQRKLKSANFFIGILFVNLTLTAWPALQVLNKQAKRMNEK